MRLKIRKRITSDDRMLSLLERLYPGVDRPTLRRAIKLNNECKLRYSSNSLFGINDHVELAVRINNHLNKKL